MTDRNDDRFGIAPVRCAPLIAIVAALSWGHVFATSARAQLGSGPLSPRVPTANADAEGADGDPASDPKQRAADPRNDASGPGEANSRLVSHGRLEVQVLDESGAAIPEGWVVLDPHPLARDPGLRAGVYRMPAAARRTDGERSAAVFESCASGPHVIAAGGPGFHAQRTRFEIEAGTMNRVRITLPAAPLATLRFAVDAGTKIASARVQLRRVGESGVFELRVPTGTKAAKQPLALLPGDYLVRLTEPLPGGTPIPLHLENQESRTLTLRVGSGAKLPVEVLDEEGNAVFEPVRLELVRFEPDMELERLAARAELVGPTAPKTDDTGRFTFGPLEPGRYVVLARRPGKDRGRSAVIRLPRTADERPVQVRLDRRDEGETTLELLLRRGFADNGEPGAWTPPERLRLELTVWIRGFEKPLRLRREADERDRVTLSGLPAERSITIEARAFDLDAPRLIGIGALRFVADQGQARLRRTLRLARPVTVRGQVVGFASRPVGPGRVRWGVMQLSGAPPEREETAPVDEQGRFVLPDLDPARKIRITAVVERHRPGTVTIEPKATIEVPVNPLP